MKTEIVGELTKDKAIKIERYFTVVFIGTSKKRSITGNFEFKTNGCYLSKSETTNQIKESFDDIIDIVITNIIERNESDENDWNYSTNNNKV